MGNNLPDRITFDVSDCCAVCHLKPAPAPRPCSVFLPPHIFMWPLPPGCISLFILKERWGSLVIVLAYFVLSTSANYFRAYPFIHSEQDLTLLSLVCTEYPCYNASRNIALYSCFWVCSFTGKAIGGGMFHPRNLTINTLIKPLSVKYRDWIWVWGELLVFRHGVPPSGGPAN
jgi:hypothetical protein